MTTEYEKELSMFGRKTHRSDIEVLAERSVGAIGSYSMALAQGLIGRQKMSNADSVRMLVYCFALNYILLDRIAFSNLPSDDRNAYSDYVFKGLSLDLAKDAGIDTRIIEELLSKYISQLSPYSGKLVGQDQESKGTLFWEFSRIVDEEFGAPPLEATTIWPEFSGKIGADLMSEIGPYFKDKVEKGAGA